MAVNGTIEKLAADLTPPHTAPQVAAEILMAVREARSLPAEAAILTFPTQKRTTR